MKTTEKVFIVIAALGVIMKLVHWPGANLLLIISLMTLTCIYTYFGFALFNDVRLRKVFKKESYKGVSAIRIIGAIGAGIGLGMGLIGILFIAMFWPGGLIMMMPALFIMTIVLVISVVKFIQTKDKFYKGILIRLIIIYGLSLFLLPIKSKMNWRYPNDSEYVEAYLKYYENPNNEIYKLNYNLERAKFEKKYPHLKR